MNKKLFFILTIIGILVSCNGRNSSKTMSNNSSFSDDVINPIITEGTMMTTKGCEEVILNISKSHIPTQLQIVMTNNSDYTALYGIGWMLYAKKDSNWAVCKPNFGFVDIGRGMHPNQKDTLYLPLNQFKQPLESGEYKLVKDITLNNQECTLTKYFKMEL